MSRYTIQATAAFLLYATVLGGVFFGCASAAYEDVDPFGVRSSATVSEEATVAPHDCVALARIADALELLALDGRIRLDAVSGGYANNRKTLGDERTEALARVLDNVRRKR